MITGGIDYSGITKNHRDVSMLEWTYYIKTQNPVHYVP